MTATSLQALLERVEAEKATSADFYGTFPDLHKPNDEDDGYHALAAYHASPDGAFALLASAAPNWAIDKMTVWPGADTSLDMIDTYDEGGERWHDIKGKRVSARHKVTSVAILIAILRALISEAE